MRIMKKITSFVFIFSLLISSCIFSVNAFSIGDDKFMYDLNSSTNEATIVSYYGSDSNVKIPSAFNGFLVTKIKDSVFMNNKTITSVLIPNTVTEIGNKAFMGCTSLKEISIPVSVTKMGTSVFSNCTSLVKAVVDPYLTKLPDNTFSGCTSLKDVDISDSVKYIGNSCFYNCSSLSSFKILESVIEIGDFSFYGTSFYQVNLSSDVANIPRLAFANNTNLKKIIISKNVNSISADAFSNCSNLTIYCYDGSYAEQYAIANNIPFEVIDKKLMGDVNLDGQLTISDVTLFQRYLADVIALGEEPRELLDYNADNKVNINDVTAIQVYIASVA